MEETIISFETAKLAKEKEFTYMQNNCFGDNMAYDEDGILICAHKANTQVGYILAPTQALLQKWLREKHEIHIEISFYDSTISKHYEASIINSNKRIYNNEEYLDCAAVIGINIKFKTYEEALEEALQESLKLIKN
jgi:hypothetical protein